jgi:AcrR family transcriptional regulator
MPDLPERTTTATRWAGLSAERRRGERRALLVAAAYDLFGTEGGASVTVRAVCRAAELNTRYFYESFPGTDELLAAVYDQQAAALGVELGAAHDAAGPEPIAKLRAGIRCVLRFVADDPRRGQVLFTGARTNAALAGRRRAALSALAGDAVVAQREAAGGAAGQRSVIAAAMFAGAMAELVQQWVDGRLGTSLDPVVDDAVALSEALFRKAMGG